MVNNEFLEDFVKNFGVKFYDLEFANEHERQIVRIYITSDTEKSVSIDQCSKISKALSPILDANPLINGEYFLEISSPGLERKLTTKRHYELSINSNVKITNKSNEKLIAKLIGIEENNILLEKDGEKITINLDDIKKAKTYIKW